MNTCNQKGCGNAAAYRFTWPGEDDAIICEDHVGWLKEVAEAMGFDPQAIPLASVQARELALELDRQLSARSALNPVDIIEAKFTPLVDELRHMTEMSDKAAKLYEVAKDVEAALRAQIGEQRGTITALKKTVKSVGNTSDTHKGERDRLRAELAIEQAFVQRVMDALAEKEVAGE